MTTAQEHLDALLETSRNIFPKRTEVHCYLNHEFSWVRLKRYTHSVVWSHGWQEEYQEMTKDGMLFGPKMVRERHKRISSEEAKELLGHIDELKNGPWAGAIHTFP